MSFPFFDGWWSRWWFHRGVECMTGPNTFGTNFNGYCRLPENSPDVPLAEAYSVVQNEERRQRRLPWSNRDLRVGYDALDYDVHGGLTFGPMDRWVGFDTAHAGDSWDPDEVRAELLAVGLDEMWLRGQSAELLLGGSGVSLYDHGMGLPWSRRWTMPALIRETNRLAAQIAAVHAITWPVDTGSTNP